MSARRIVLCLPAKTRFYDPTPEETAKRDVELSASWDGTPAGVVGFAEGGWAALTLAAKHQQLVDRLVLVSAPAPGTEPTTIDLEPIEAKTLLLFGTRDEAVSPPIGTGGETGSTPGSRWCRTEGTTSSCERGRASSLTSHRTRSANDDERDGSRSSPPRRLSDRSFAACFPNTAPLRA